MTRAMSPQAIQTSPVLTYEEHELKVSNLVLANGARDTMGELLGLPDPRLAHLQSLVDGQDIATVVEVIQAYDEHNVVDCSQVMTSSRMSSCGQELHDKKFQEWTPPRAALVHGHVYDASAQVSVAVDIDVSLDTTNKCVIAW